MSDFSIGNVVLHKDSLYIIISDTTMIPIDSTNCNSSISWAVEQSGIELEFVSSTVWDFIQETFEKAALIVKDPVQLIKVPEKVKLRKHW